jgi:hypothetical protein
MKGRAITDPAFFIVVQAFGQKFLKLLNLSKKALGSI